MTRTNSSTLNISIMKGVTSGTRTANPLGAPVLTSGF